MIGGGSFMDGFKQGLITSGLNHAAHAALDPKSPLEKVLESNGIDPSKTAPFEMSSVDKIMQIEMFSDMNGRNTTLKLVPSKVGDITMGWFDDSNNTIELYSITFRSYLNLAPTIGHEFQHVKHYYNNFKIWGDTRQNFTRPMLKDYSEYLSYKWEYNWTGNKGHLDFYKNKSNKNGIIKVFGE